MAAPNPSIARGSTLGCNIVVNELGYAVVAPNLRGSSGYGKSYQALDNGQQRDDVVKDLGALIVWIGLAERFRCEAGGGGRDGSYGGYLALAAAASNYGDRLTGAVDLGGIGDFVSFLTSTAPYRQNRRRAEYGDERDPDMRAYLRRISPLTNADRIATTPARRPRQERSAGTPSPNPSKSSIDCAAAAARCGIYRPRMRATVCASSRIA